MRVSLTRDPTFRDLDWVLGQLPASPREPREDPLAPSVRPGDLPTLQGVVQESVAWHQDGEPAATSPVGRVAAVRFDCTTYDLVLRLSKRIAAARYRGRAFEDLIQGAFLLPTRRRGKRRSSRCSILCAGALAGVPIHGVYRPRWWFEVEMTLNDPAAAPTNR